MTRSPVVKVRSPTVDWRRLERAAFGLIYGAILVLSLLMAAGDGTKANIRFAAILFGSMLAVTLARGFAELIAHAIETGERMLTPRALCAAWHGGHAALSVAVIPTALFCASQLGGWPDGLATALSQAYCIAILAIFGARVGWVIGHGPALSIGGAVFAGTIGTALAAMKYVLR